MPSSLGDHIGNFLPIRSAAGKVFMAFMDEQIIHDWRAKEFKQMAPEKVNHLEDECRIMS